MDIVITYISSNGKVEIIDTVDDVGLAHASLRNLSKHFGGRGHLGGYRSKDILVDLDGSVSLSSDATPVVANYG